MSFFKRQSTTTQDKKEELPVLKRYALYVLLFLILYGAGHFLPPGFDWVIFFSKGNYPPPWMPWTNLFFGLLNLPAVFAITVLAIGLRSFKYSKSPLPIILALISLPTLWTLFMGNLDGVVLAGLLFLPFSAPLLLTKPQIAAFALLANRKALVIGIIWIVISILIWGFWPSNLLVVQSAEWKAEWTHDINLFPWGLLIALPLMWFSRGDEDLMMAAGSFGTPHMFPYTFIVLMPSLSRMNTGWMLLTWLVSWSPLLANWFGPDAWHLGNLMSVCFWLGIYLKKKKDLEEIPDSAGPVPNLVSSA